MPACRQQPSPCYAQTPAAVAIFTDIHLRHEAATCKASCEHEMDSHALWCVVHVCKAQRHLLVGGQQLLNACLDGRLSKAATRGLGLADDRVQPATKSGAGAESSTRQHNRSRTMRMHTAAATGGPTPDVIASNKHSLSWEAVLSTISLHYYMSVCGVRMPPTMLTHCAPAAVCTHTCAWP